MGFRWGFERKTHCGTAHPSLIASKVTTRLIFTSDSGILISYLVMKEHSVYPRTLLQQRAVHLHGVCLSQCMTMV